MKDWYFTFVIDDDINENNYTEKITGETEEIPLSFKSEKVNKTNSYYVFNIYALKNTKMSFNLVISK